MNVRDLMTTDVMTVPPRTGVAEVAKAMIERRLSGIPVVSQTGQMLGLVTENDVVAKHMKVHTPTYFGILGYTVPIGQGETDEELRRTLAETAEDLMESDPPTVHPDTDIDDAATLMIDRHANPLPVIENGRLIGIISAADIIRLVLREEDDEQSVQ